MSKIETEIQRVLNVKIVVLILVGTIFYSLNAQNKPHGTYCKEYDLKDLSNCLTFETERNFKYEYSGDTGMFEFGKGEYQLIDHQLILSYNKTKPIKIGHHVSEIWTNTKDSIYLQFHVFDFDSLPLPAVSVVYADSLSKHGYSGVASNERGIAQIKLKRDRGDLQIEISTLGFNAYKFSLDKNYNHVISVYLQKSGHGLPIKNQLDTLQIEKMKPKYFTVSNKNGSITKWRRRKE